jgi:hypothetical protein
MTYHPKGGMCVTCRHFERGCSHLPFKTMPVIDSYVDDTGVVYIVKCADFKRENTEVRP